MIIIKKKKRRRREEKGGKRRQKEGRRRVVGWFFSSLQLPFLPSQSHPPIYFNQSIKANPISIPVQKREEGIEREMGEAVVARYWCYMCSQMVNPIMEAEIKCPFCESGFLEEMDGSREPEHNDLGSERTLSLWAPILLGMMGSGSSRRRRFRREEEEELQGEMEFERESESIIRRRRRRSSSSSAAILQLLQGLRAGIGSELENMESDGERGPVILVNPFNQAVILQGSFDSNQTQNQNQNLPGGSLGDYFIGPGLDMLLQHLADNDPSRYGTPPARKEAVESMPTVKVGNDIRCSVCLDDFEIGSEAKEMPCKHKFHNGCILPWLELHSSCPVCRFQLPVNDGSKDGNGSNSVEESNSSGGEDRSSGDEGGNSGGGRRFWVPVPWPFNGLFSSSSGSQFGRNNTSSPSSSASSGNASRTTEEN